MKQLRRIAVILLALEFCWRVFLEFEEPEYSAEGVAAFRQAWTMKNAPASLPSTVPTMGRRW